MTEWTRRGAIAAGGALAAMGIAGSKLTRVRETGLNAVAKTKGMRFGSAVGWSPPKADRGSFSNPQYASLLERNCGVLVPENELKWQTIRPGPKAFDLSHFTEMLAYADREGMAMRGHTLLWHKAERFPDWLNKYNYGTAPVKTAEALLTQHIKTLCKLYGTRIYSFDVVNETVDERTGELRTSGLSRAMGGTEAMLDLAFHTAREAAPSAELVYNDYMSWEPGNTKFRSGVLELLEGFRRRGVPCDALGLQSHIRPVSNDSVATLARRQGADWRRFLDQVTAMGYRLVITEFDVNDRALPDGTEFRDRRVADYAKAYLDICFAYPQLRDVLVWGLCDKYTWLNALAPRADKQIHRATPYDVNFKPKPLYAAIEQAFQHAPARTR